MEVGEDGAPGFYNNFWLDWGTETVETRRTSLILDPPNGRFPPLTQAADARRAAARARRRGLTMHEPTSGGWVEDLGADGLQVRCITGFNSGPPMTPSGFTSNVQLFLTPDYVVLLNEMNHNARIVPLDGRPHLDLPQWTGDSRGGGKRTNLQQSGLRPRLRSPGALKSHGIACEIRSSGSGPLSNRPWLGPARV